jgi:voltage-gated potassium channel
MTPVRRLRLLLALLVVLAATGTLGYVTIEGFSLLDALYMTVTTLTTVGFGEIHPLSPAGRAFTIGLIVVGLSVVYGAIGSVLEMVFGEHLRESVNYQRMERRVNGLKDHSIVCGYGRMGQEIAREFHGRQIPFVIVERDPALAAMLTEAGYMFVTGDASEDAVLLLAGVERARSLITVAPTDADNIFITLTGRSLNPKLHIVARSIREADEHKLRRAGADRVVSPYVIGARRIAASVYRPAVVDFLDIQSHGAEREMELDDIAIAPSADYCGKTLRSSGIRERTGCTVLAVRAPDGRYESNPDPERVLGQGDRMIVLGTAAQIDALQRLGR